MDSIIRHDPLDEDRAHDLARLHDALRQSCEHPLFDAAWYLVRNQDVAAAGFEPLAHYLRTGHREGREPHWLIDTPWYFAQQPDADRTIATLAHYAVIGGPQGISPHPLFDVAHYAARRGALQGDALGDYLQHGAQADLSPHPLFDAAFYLETNPDVAAAGMNPLDHFLSSGAAQGRDPHPLFDTAWYAFRYREQLGGLNPLVHYVTMGAVQGLDPHPLFNAAYYVVRSGDSAAARQNALIHYLAHGAADPNPLFDRAWYATTLPPSDVDPLIHYVRFGSRRRSPHPLFDAVHYLAWNPDVAASGQDPLAHYLSSGAAELRDPHPLFVSCDYVAQAEAAGLSGAQLNPLAHYVTVGAAHGLSPNRWFDPAYYLRRNGDVADAGLNPALHYALAGARERRDPHPLFNTEYYLAHAPDVAEAGRDALGHFLRGGEREGRQPRPPDRLTPECAVTDIPFEILRDPPPAAGREVCLFVTFSADGAVAAHVLTHLSALRSAGLMIVLAVATDGLDRPFSPQAMALADGVLVRTNHGWDFAAWAAALTAFPDLWQASLLLLLNDSVYGPVDEAALCAVIERARRSSADLVALTDSRQVRHHVQSYFVAITRTGLAHTAIRSFWQGVRSVADKDVVIARYELGLLGHAELHGAAVDVVFPTPHEHAADNPTLVLWRELLDQGFPYIKVQLLRDALAQADPSGWQERLAGAPALVEQIEAHLAAGRPATARRPVPSPRRRFHRDFALRTYYGAVPSCRPTDATDLALEAPFRYPAADPPPALRIGVFAHVFYPELTSLLMRSLANVPASADLFISTSSAAKKRAIGKALGPHAFAAVEIRVMPNIGRDIAPLVVGFADVIANYDVFLHVHSKKSPHEGRFAPWRDYLLENLLGSPEMVRSILELFEHTDVGLVFSQHFPEVRELLNFGGNFDALRVILARAGASLSKDLVLDFPSSSFFWGRTAALRPLLAQGFSWDDFPAEQGQIDGTLAHAIERSLLYIVEAAGYRWAKVARAGGLIADRVLVPVHDRGDLGRSLTRVHRWLTGNRLAPVQGRGAITELAPIPARPDRNPRPRLTLLVPTLQPAKVFGGLTTALRIFDEVADALGPEFDRRLVVTTDAVDLDSMAAHPAYRLAAINAVDDTGPRIVVDATDHEGGELTVRAGDVFVASAWWTAVPAYDLQAMQLLHHKFRNAVVYLIQDHEPDFYGWSARFGAAQATYASGLPMLPLVNSEELANFMAATYGIKDGFVIPFEINPAINRSLVAAPKERVILVYGRPGTPRNCFEVLWQALHRWQQSEPTIAAQWRIVSAGETFDPELLPRVDNLEVGGKLSLAEYGALLSRAAVGVSLMLSPHPSYPPLEMASAGVVTITNDYATKQLARRSDNIIGVLQVTVEAVTAALTAAVARAEGMIGKVPHLHPLRDIPCALPRYDPRAVAARIVTGLAR